MRIGIDIRLIGKKRTGDEAVFFNLTKALAELKTNHEFTLFTDNCNKEQVEEIRHRLGVKDTSNFKIVSVRSRNRFFWNLYDLSRALKSNPVDVYLTQYITPFFVSKIKMVTIIHDMSFNFFPQFIKKSDLFFLKIFIPLSIKRSTKVLGVSEFTKNEIVKFYGVNSDKVDFFHNALSEGISGNVSLQEIEKVRKKYNLPEKYILYLGTLQPRKNIPFLIESYARIKDKIGETKLVLVGNKHSHNFDRGIDEAVGKLGLQDSVIFPGYVDEEDKYAIYKASHVFAFPSLYEGFGIPILDAFCSGVPVLASDIPSFREVASDAALFGDCRDVDNFSNALYNICIDEYLRKSLVAKGLDRARFFSWEKTAKKILAVFESI